MESDQKVSFGVMCAADFMSHERLQSFARQAESAGLDQVWVPELLGRDPFVTASVLLSATRSIRVGTAIANVYVRDARATKAAAFSLTDAFGERFDLGLGVSNPIGNEPRGHAWLAPVAKLTDFVTRYDAANLFVKPEQAAVPRYLAAHGPKLMGLAGQCFDGAFTYLQTLEYSGIAKQLLGDGRLNLMQPTVFSEDADRARALARRAISIYLPLENYHRAWRERGFSDADFAEGGSDAFIDALIPWGSRTTIAARFRDQLAQGVEHIIMTPLGLDLGQDRDWDEITGLIEHVKQAS